MRRSIIGLSLFVGLSLELVSSSAVAQATNNNLVQNGSFEVGYEATTQINGGWPSNHGFWAPIGYAGATDTIPDWTVSGGGADWHDSDSSVPNSMIAADGNRMVDLNSGWGSAPGVISQTIATTPGVFVYPELLLLRSPLLGMLLWAEAHAGERRERLHRGLSGSARRGISGQHQPLARRFGQLYGLELSRR